MTEENRDPDTMESSNITDAEFKTLVINKLNKLRGSVNKLGENFNKELKSIKMEMKMEITKGNQSETKLII